MTPRRSGTRPQVADWEIADFSAHSQSYSIDWYKVSGGFCSLYAVQTPGAPLLTITFRSNQAVVSWSPSVTGWTLQTNANPATPTWGNYLGAVVNNSVTNAPPKGTVFFRLAQP